MSKASEKLKLEESQSSSEEEERKSNPTDPTRIQQERCNYGTGYGEDLQHRFDVSSKYFPRSKDADKRYCLMGRSGVRVSKICLGTLNFGQIDEKYGSRPGQLNEQQAHEILNKYVELGGNCIDTGNFYPWFGTKPEQMAETFIGSWLKNIERDKVFIISKVGLPSYEGMNAEDINSYGVSRVNIYNTVENTLKRLQTQYIDLLQLQVWDPTVNVYDVVRHLDELIRRGRVRYFGVSGFKGWQLQKILDASRMLSLHRCVCYDGEYNLFTRGVETEVAEVCKLEKIGFFAHSPLKYGLLSQNYDYHAEKAPEGSRCEAAQTENFAAMSEPYEEFRKNPTYACTLDTCKRIAEKHSLNISQVAIMWALQKRFVTSVVLSVSNVDELQQNMDILNKGLVLEQEEFDELNNVTSMEMNYPYQISMVAIDDSRCYPEQFPKPFKSLSLLPVLLGEQIFRQPHHMRQASEKHEEQPQTSEQRQQPSEGQQQEKKSTQEQQQGSEQRQQQSGEQQQEQKSKQEQQQQEAQKKQQEQSQQEQSRANA